MPVSADILRKLATLSLSTEQMTGVLDILADMQASDEERRAAQRERTRRHRAGNVTVTPQERDEQRDTFPEERKSPAPPKETQPLPQKKPPPSGESKKRGARIPEGFQPDIEAAVSEGCSRPLAEREARKFVDHFRAASGERAVKLDWPATWRNWFRRAMDQGGIAGTTGPPENVVKFRDADEYLAEVRERREQENRKSGNLFG